MTISNPFSRFLAKPNTEAKVEQKAKDLQSRYPKTQSILAEYAAGAIAWEERDGDLRVRLSNAYRIIGALAVALILSLLIAYSLLAKSKTQVVAVKLDGNGRVLGTAEAISADPSLAEAVKREELKAWILHTRSVLSEWNAQTEFVYDAMRKTLDDSNRQARATTKLRQWYESNNPKERAEHQSVTVKVDPPLPVPGSNTYQVNWTESVDSSNGTAPYVEKWTGLFRVALIAPDNTDAAMTNGTGFRVLDFQWSKGS